MNVIRHGAEADHRAIHVTSQYFVAGNLCEIRLFKPPWTMCRANRQLHHAILTFVHLFGKEVLSSTFHRFTLLRWWQALKDLPTAFRQSCECGTSTVRHPDGHLRRATATR